MRRRTGCAEVGPSTLASVTHEYTILFGGTVIPGGDVPEGSAIAYALDTVLLVGSDDDVRSISRGDSHFIDLHGAFVVPAGEAIEAGGAADFVVLDGDPRVVRAEARTLAVVQGGRVVRGRLDRPGAGSG